MTAINSRECRRKLHEKQGGRCHYCGDRFQIGQGDVDHRTPKSRGGANAWANLVFSCFRCNRDKSDQTHEEFVAERMLAFKQFLLAPAAQEYLFTKPD